MKMDIEIGKEFFVVMAGGRIEGPFKVKEILKRVFKLDMKGSASFLIDGGQVFGGSSYTARYVLPFTVELVERQEKQEIDRDLKQEIKFLTNELDQNFNWLTAEQKTALTKELRAVGTRILTPYGKPHHQLKAELKEANEAANKTSGADHLRNIFTRKKDTY